MPSPSEQRPSEDLRIGRYRVIGELARGRISRVFKAEDPEKKRLVAVKVLDTDFPDRSEAAEWFEREAAGVARLNHPNIARIFDCGITGEHKPYLVMEYIEGISLDRLIRRKVSLPFSAMIDLALQTCQGLQAAARQNIVHLDIKPANLMVESAARAVKIVDFGLSRQLWRPAPKTASGGAPPQSADTIPDTPGPSPRAGRPRSPESTMPGAPGPSPRAGRSRSPGSTMPGAPGSRPRAGIEGTPRYMSPEQCRGIGIDLRSDIYSAGATFYHLFAAQPPFDAATDAQLIGQRATVRLIPIHEIHPEVPQEICDIIERMMALDPNDRHPDYEALIADLETAKLAQMAREVAAPLAGLTPEAGETGSQTGRADETALSEGAWAWVQKHPALFAASGALLLLLLVSLLFRPLNEEERKQSLGPVGSVLKDILVPKDSPETTAAGKNRLHMRLLAQAARRYIETNGAPPSSLDQLEEAALISPGNSLDAWDQPLALVPERGVILSLGADGLPETGDEWEITFDGRFTRTPETEDAIPAATVETPSAEEEKSPPKPENTPL